MEAYTIASKLTFSTNAVTIVADLLRSFGELDRVIGTTQTSLSRLATEMRTLNRGGGGIGRSVEALQRLSTVRLSPELVSGMANLARNASEAAAATRSLGRAATTTPATAVGRSPAGQPPGSPLSGRPRAAAASTHHELLNTAIGLNMAGDEGMGFFGGALKAEMEVKEQLASLKMNTKIGDDDLAKARALAERMNRETPGTKTAENLHSIVEAFTIMGSLEEAMKGAPAFGRASYLLQHMPGQHRGDTAFAAAQATELMQRHIVDGKVDMEAFNKEMADIVQVAYGTGGRVDGGSYLGFAKQARVGGMVANDQYLHRDLPAMLIALGGNRAGTGDAALWSQFVTGKMTANAFGELQRAGIVDNKAKWAHGQVQDMEHHLLGAGEFGQNRVQWIRDYFYGENGIFKKNGIDPHDKLATSRFLSKWNSRQTGLGFMGEAVLGIDNIDKEAAKIDATTRDPMAVLRESDPSQAVREFKAAENELMVSLGKEALGPAIEALKGLTTAIRELSDWAKAHPETAKDIVLVGGGLSILAKGAGELALVLYAGAPVVLGLRALATAATLFAVGSPAGLALTALGLGITGLAAALHGAPIPGTPEAKKFMDDVDKKLEPQNRLNPSIREQRDERARRYHDFMHRNDPPSEPSARPEHQEAKLYGGAAAASADAQRFATRGHRSGRPKAG